MSFESNVLKVLQLLSSDLEEVRSRRASGLKGPPLVIGLTGLQGSGKSTWATAVVKLLSSHFELKAIQVSLDDFYHTHDDLVKIRDKNAGNQLLRTRGQPGTHDQDLASSFFQRLRKREPGNRIPVFEKSLYNGEGDRLSDKEWPRVPVDVDIVVFEGWCVGFKPLPESEIVYKQQAARTISNTGDSCAARTITLADHAPEHLLAINEKLNEYCESFMGSRHFDFLIHLDTDQLKNVYMWRTDQEHALAKARGSSMSDDEVVKFVRGYMPAYELYLDQLRKGFFPVVSSGNHRKPQVHVLLGRKREILQVSRF